MAFVFVFVPFAALSFFLFPSPGSAQGTSANVTDVRPPILAGTWYPGDRVELKETILHFLSKADLPPVVGELKAVIVPHAGYMYSGQVAACAYRLLQERRFKRVILVGPSHRMPFRGVSVNLQSGYKTPLGVVPVDRLTGQRILDQAPFASWVKEAHAMEHSLEIQLPFLQVALSRFQIVPILMGQQNYEMCLKLAKLLVDLVRGEKETLLLASCDLSHFHSYEEAKALDHQFIHHVRTLDPEGLDKDLSSGKCEACGGGPVKAIMIASQGLGADRAFILNYANSGDVTGDRRRVVGYLSAAFTSSKRNP